MFTLSFFASAQVRAAVKAFTAVPAQSELSWKGTKVTGFHVGTLKLKSGKFAVEEGQLKSGEFDIDMTSLANTDIKDEGDKAKLVGHLKSDDFFSVEKFPVATLKVTQAEPLKDGGANTHTLSGELTIKGATHPISFPAKVEVKTDAVEAKATVTVDRTLYNVRYGSGKFFQNLGNKMIHDTFTVDVKLLAKAEGASPKKAAPKKSKKK